MFLSSCAVEESWEAVEYSQLGDHRRAVSGQDEVGEGKVTNMVVSGRTMAGLNFSSRCKPMLGCVAFSLAFCLLGQSGCSSRTKSSPATASPRLHMVAVLYGKYVSAHGGELPTDEQDFVAYVDAIGHLDGTRSLLEWKTTASRYPEEPEGLLALDPQLVCYSWITGIAEVAHVVFVRKRLVEVQYLRTTITDRSAPTPPPMSMPMNRVSAG